MTNASASPLSPLARRAVDDLVAIREQWGDLLDAIARPRVTEWPPRERGGFLDQLATDDRGRDDAVPTAPVIGRVPLVLREHPAPANLDALDTAVHVERSVFALADALADAVQHVPATDTRHWHPRSPGAVDGLRAAGSRAYGLHWACVWIEDRVLGTGTQPERDGTGAPVTAPFDPLPAHLLDEVVRVTRDGRRRIARVLTPEAITATRTLPVPCPGCGGALSVSAAPAEPPTVTCTTGAACGADEQGHRVWEWPASLPLLLSAARGAGGATWFSGDVA
ncbi:hypothetical protein [Streptomyces sp. NPDC003077]|uniref:hypothetical protein n=1 Tax=Streptomyces sp. NPDC003077 TaxID=3154443 RepID=UPI0033B3A230